MLLGGMCNYSFACSRAGRREPQNFLGFDSRSPQRKACLSPVERRARADSTAYELP